MFHQIMIMELCRIIYPKKRRRNSNLLSLHFYLRWCTQCGKSFCMGLKQGILLLFGKQKQPRKKMVLFLSVNWDQSYSFIPIFILLVCTITIMSNNLLKKKKNIVTCYHSNSIGDDARNMERVSDWGMKQRIILSFGK